ncbi:hypothetical protein SPSIL_039920 [Sporomusa silvacetica DSM 10669]|uniref:Uroporphyrinogen decarboxylase (URO-D) domain-containing protein n=1 Tax=Sporomusa silvacetica DSM 10669 TaxID=1123289 RepID=A0ABZ3IQT0_9FIRM|nr:uroporphyrinogen decarboxylase family protein [Sporomusa silvacetica]OZC16297.1 uroporphyrinogen decarboxylase (URO-D) [Sporomusa silvacetica DSM 10669]
MEYSSEYMANLQRFKDCINFKPIDRVLHYSNVYTWKALDSDIKPKLSDAISDFDLIEQIQCEFHERYRFDGHSDLGTRNLTIGPVRALGSTHYIIDDELETINFTDRVIMEATEYEEYAVDRERVHWRMFHRKHPNLTKGQMVAAISKFIECGEFIGYMTKKMNTVYNVPAGYNGSVAGVMMSPIERFHKYYRGIREISLDLRRHKKELLKACDAIHEEEMLPGLKAGLKIDNSAYITDMFTALLAHTTLSRAQWDELYWPYLKQYLDAVVEAGKTISVFCEGSILRFADYFKEYPKGHLLFTIELDDPVELRKALPNVCLSGGMPASLLGHGTPEQCVEYAKRLVGEMGDGFILSQDKMISFRNDCKRENLLAVAEFVQNYRC